MCVVKSFFVIFAACPCVSLNTPAMSQSPLKILRWQQQCAFSLGFKVDVCSLFGHRKEHVDDMSRLIDKYELEKKGKERRSQLFECIVLAVP